MAVKIFFCYAREDEALLNKLKTHLKPLQRQGLIDVWYDRDISAGTEWEQEIHKHLNEAQIILLLISPDFMASDYCYGIEMKQAIERHVQGDARVIPIVLRPSDLDGTPINKLQMLPTERKPVTKWRSRDEAFLDVALAIRKAIEDQWPNVGSILSLRWQQRVPITDSPSDADEFKIKREIVRTMLNRADGYSSQQDHDKAIFVIHQALELDAVNAIAHCALGDQLYYLKRYEEAIAAHKQAIYIDPNDAITYYHLGSILFELKHYDEALVAFDQGLRNNRQGYIADNERGLLESKALVLYELKRYEEALNVYDELLKKTSHIYFHETSVSLIYHNIGTLLSKLKQYEKAVIAYGKSIQFHPERIDSYIGKGIALEKLGRRKEAQQSYEQAQKFTNQ